jgi:two-component system, chemotaxis family, CheB/CheR fusion protein
VQEPQTAEFDGMPRSAMATGLANYVLPVEQMPQAICRYTHHPYVSSSADTVTAANYTKALHGIFDMIVAKHGHDFSSYKPGTLVRRIHRRMGLHVLLKLSDYLALLKKDPAELTALFQDLLIGVTGFFRDPEAWKALDAEVIAPLVASKRAGEPLRIWIPGCSTGEEAYTMAMVALERLRRAHKQCPVQIFATDANPRSLDIGRLGRYPIGIAAQVSPLRLKRYFVSQPGASYFSVNNQLRESVIFGVQNVFSDPPFGKVDLISCRNVLIYLEPEVQKRVLRIFNFALCNHAYLFLGSAESNAGQDAAFKPISKKWRIYQREGALPPDILPLQLQTSGVRPADFSMPPKPAPDHAASIAQKLVLDRFAPASVLINSHNETLYFCGPTDEYLTRPRGVPTQDLLAMVREGLRSRVHAALHECASTKLPAVVPDARMKTSTGFVPVHITVVPSDDAALGPMVLVVFRKLEIQPLSLDPKTHTGALVRHLEEELQATKRDLQDTVEGLKASNESLRVAYEEVTTSNEELRSLNEELESSKEELQSLNEELLASNQQLEVKVREIEASNSDLQNLLSSNDIATLCLDNTLHIKWFTPATQTQFNFVSSDIGRPLSDFAMDWDSGGLLDAARDVLKSKTVSLQESQSKQGRLYVRRILPYISQHGAVQGVVVTYTDITELHRAEQTVVTVQKELLASRLQHSQLRTLSAALALAEERERRALAQDLHDDLGQVLAVAALKMVAIKKLVMPTPVKHAVDSCAKVVDEANRKLRTMAFQLSPPLLQDLGLAAALAWVADEMRQVYKLDVKCIDDGNPKPLDPALSATLFRAVRELLINVAKHANVQSATVHAVVESAVDATQSNTENLLVTVTDTGVGFDASTTGRGLGQSNFGLFSVRERLGLLGGSMAIRNRPGQGTSVVLTVPLLNPARPASGLHPLPILEKTP